MINRSQSQFYNFASLLHAGGLVVRLYDGPDLKLFILVGLVGVGLSVSWPTVVQLVIFFCFSGISVAASSLFHYATNALIQRFFSGDSPS